MIRQIVLKGFRPAHFPVVIQGSRRHSFRLGPCASRWPRRKGPLPGPPTALLDKASAAREGNRLCRPPEAVPKMKGMKHYGKCRSLAGHRLGLIRRWPRLKDALQVAPSARLEMARAAREGNTRNRSKRRNYEEECSCR